LARPIDFIKPAPENDTRNGGLYRPINPNDPEIIALAKSIRKNGLREPIMITKDGFVLSGHRRLAAAKLAGLTKIHCRVENIRHDSPDFVVHLCEYNRQREKSLDEKLREEIVSANPEESHRLLIEQRKRAADVSVAGFHILGRKHRAKIS